MTPQDYANLLIIYMASGMVMGALCVGFAYQIRDWWRSHVDDRCVHGDHNPQCRAHYGGYEG